MASQAPATLISDVREAIAFQSGTNVAAVVNTAKLGDDLGMMTAALRALAIPFEDIADEFGSVTITRDEAAACATVLDCINLVATKAGFAKQQ